ncbi:MAG: hypothetical protein ACRCTI_12290 [Beijerinckiaceae bacterium]
MFETIYRLTSLSVARGVGFAALGILCVMVGFAGDAVNVLRSGGFGALLVAVTLLIKADKATPESYRRTEVWIMLKETERPPREVAGTLIANVRREILLAWALRSAWASALMLGAAAFFILLRRG